jgi:hypothetical protein
MKIKQSLESLVRGWMPRDPIIGSTKTKSKTYRKTITNTTVKTGAGLLSVIGSILLSFSVYIYLINPHAWHLAWVTNTAFIAIGIISIVANICLWSKDRKQIRGIL